MRVERFDGRLKDGYFCISTNSNRRRFINNKGCLDCYCPLQSIEPMIIICHVQPKINWQKSWDFGTEKIDTLPNSQPICFHQKLSTIQCNVKYIYRSSVYSLTLAVCVCLHYTKSGSFITKSSDDRTWLTHTRFLSLSSSPSPLCVWQQQNECRIHYIHCIRTDMFATKMKA